MFERQTSYSLEELIRQFPSPSVIPDCMIFSEIGIIFLQGTAESPQAEKFLLEQMERSNYRNSTRALCFLMTDAKKLSPEGAKKVEGFKSRPENAEKVETAAFQVAEALDNLRATN